MAAIEIKALRKSYGGHEALKGVDLRCGEGEFLVLVGPSGCGKSTLLNMIAGLDDISHGEIRIGGRNVAGVAPKDRDIAMVFQSYALYPTMTARENIAFGMEMRKVPKPERVRRIAEAADLLQIKDILERKPSQLSGGQRQRVAMGRALVRRPSVFLFDEPLSNLDARLRVEMRTELKRLHQRLKTTMVYVTHDQIEAMTLATKVAVMKDGVVHQAGDPQTVYDLPKNTFVAGFIGSPAINLIAARLEGPLVAAVSRPGGDPLRIPLARQPAEPGADLILGIRPEDITEPRGRKDERELFSFECLVDVVEPTGPDTMALLSLGESKISARVSPGSACRPGQEMRFSLDPAKILFFDPGTRERI